MKNPPKENEVKLKITQEQFDIAISHVKSVTLDVKPREEINTLYDTSKGSLKKKKHVLRVRELKGAYSPIELTFKGKADSDGAFSSRTEVNLPIEQVQSDYREKLDYILKMLGYEPSFTYEKKRNSYHLYSMECLVEFDWVPFCGLFVEIEGPSKAKIDEVIKFLELQDAEFVGASYPKILRQAMKKAKIPGNKALFSLENTLSPA